MSVVMRSVTKRYGPRTAVDQLSLEIRAGELFAFLGPNGAGKTTTLKLTAGLLRANEGEVRVCGYLIGGGSANRADGMSAKALMAYVPDQPFIYEKLTGREFLEFVAKMYRLPTGVQEQRQEELTEALGMSGFLDQYAESYSHGMKQRLVLASAFLHEPKVLVIDEPMVGLDPRGDNPRGHPRG